MARGFKMGGSGGRFKFSMETRVEQPGKPTAYMIFEADSYSKVHLGGYAVGCEKVSIEVQGKNRDDVSWTELFGTTLYSGSGTLNRDIDLLNYEEIVIELFQATVTTGWGGAEITDCYIE